MSSSLTDSGAGNGGGPGGENAPTEVVMPQMGVSVAEGTIASWLKRPGDRVAADEAICEVTTDKIDVEIPSPAAGTLTEILVETGTTVAVGTVIALLGEGGRAAGTSASPAERGGGEIDRSSFYSPVVRRIAAEHGIDLSTVAGRGVGGRVRKADLIEHIRASREAPNGGGGNGGL
jgi:pyruvate/2-oxoglutarate dehydrogenase complex dihydrolipoamide acyltransferase (E2) component